MKKIRIIVALFILTFSFSVKAEVFMEIDCNSKNVTNKSKINCEVNLVYEEVSIDDIDFEYATNLDIEFSAISGFSLSKSGNKVSIHAATPLYDEIMNSDHIVKFTLKAKEDSNEKESLTLKNIKINKSNTVPVDNVSETFNVTVENTLDSDCYLNNITIDKVSISGFDKDKLEYKGIVVNKNIVSLDAVRSSEKSSATGLGDVFIKSGETIEHDIEVVAEDKTKKVYKLYITNNSTASDSDEDENSLGMELSSDNSLKSLELYNGKEKLPFKFNNKKDTFDIVIERDDLEKITIKAVTNHAKATFLDGFGPRDVNVSLGNNKILIKVKAENKNEKTYTLNINLKEGKSNDNTLSSLKINDEIVDLVDDVFTYDVILPKDALKTKIEAVANNEKAKVEFKDIDLTDGENKMAITVIAENGDKKEYHVNITKSDKNILKAIEVEGYSLGFTKGQVDYILKIDKDDTELKISVDPSDIDYEVIDNSELHDGSIVKIKVDDATGLKEYKITILKDNNKISMIVYGVIILIAIIIVGLIIYMIRKKRKNNSDIDVI